MPGGPRRGTDGGRMALGRHGEEAAARHYADRGYIVVDRNWRCSIGELDLVLMDETTRTVVFCEVKTRSGMGHGTGFEAVTPAKVRRVRRLAGRWLAEARPPGLRPAEIRVDAAWVRPAPGGGFVVEVLESVG